MSDWGEWFREWDRLCRKWQTTYSDPDADATILGSLIGAQKRHLASIPDARADDEDDLPTIDEALRMGW